jgi:ribosome-associated protein
MDGDDDLRTAGGLVVPAEAMVWSFARSGGPGGQHVNTTSSRATLVVDVTQVRARSHVRERLVAALGAELRVSSQATRSQWRNRQECLAQAAARLDEAARPPAPPRRPTKPGRGAVERRLEDKRRASEKKTARRPDAW